MNEKRLKYIFWSSSLILLIVMLFAASNAGISCDEVLHYGQSVDVYNYFATGGEDRAALEDSELNLKYYGQSYDNIVTIVTKWTGLEDIYTFRHYMSVLMGWLTIVVSALFAKWLKDYRSAFFTLLLFAITPVFIGHSYNNLKDIPFAFAYIAGIWFILRFITKPGKVEFRDALLLTFTMAFCIGIRAGGLILICYLFLFFFIMYFRKYLEKGVINTREVLRKTAWIFAMSLIAMLLSCILWPFALQDPLRNIIESYKVMAHYPATFRQLFEGKMEWSDYMPWYYLFKSMAITIPVVVFAGIMVFVGFTVKISKERNALAYGMLAFTVIFPVVFVIFEKSNLYSSWRQFLFVYPGIVIMSATGLSFLLDTLKRWGFQLAIVVIFLFLCIHPVKFMIKNHPYEYLYYNELTGGVKGAYANYEQDYYYASQTEASEWLISYLKDNNITDPVKVAATYSVSWDFRDQPGVETSWFRFEERSMHDWDYAIVVNRYIPPFQLRNKIWPPENSIHVIEANGVPLCAILERRTKDDYLGHKAFNEGNYEDAVGFYSRALSVNDDDEMIFYNFAGALNRAGDKMKADSVLKEGLKLNPESDLILMYLGNIALSKGNNDVAAGYYERVIEVNRKYLDAYVSLAKILLESDILQARELLRKCLTINPRYKPAIIALGDTYLDTNPEIANKYYEQANN